MVGSKQWGMPTQNSKPYACTEAIRVQRKPHLAPEVACWASIGICRLHHTWQPKPGGSVLDGNKGRTSNLDLTQTFTPLRQELDFIKSKSTRKGMKKLEEQEMPKRWSRYLLKLHVNARKKTGRLFPGNKTNCIHPFTSLYLSSARKVALFQ